MTALRTQPLAGLEPLTAASSAPEGFRPIVRTLRSRWRWTVTGLLLAVVVVFITRNAAGDRQEFSAAVLHTPLPAAEVNKHMVQMGDLKSLSAMVKSPASMNDIVNRHELDLSPKALADRIEIKTAPGLQTVAVGLQWRGAGDGEAVLNDILAAFVLRAAELRGQRLGERISDFETSRLTCEGELAGSREKLLAFYRENDIVDLPHELRSATHELDGITTALAQCRRNESSCQAQIAEIDKTVERLTGQDKASGGTRQTPQRIQQLIEEERRREQSQARLAIKTRELERIQKVAAAGAASQVELDRINGEIAALQAAVKDNDKIKEWKEELTLIEQGGNAPQPVLQQAFSKKLDLDLVMLGYRKELDLLTADHGQMQARVDKLLKLQTRATPLLWAVDRAEAERSRLQSHIDQLRVLAGMTGGEVRVHQPAAPVPKPMGGTRVWVMPLAVGGCAMLMWVGALVALRPNDPGPSYRSLVTGMGLPVMAQIPATVSARRAGTSDPNVRSVVMSLRHMLPKSGISVLFIPIRGGERAHEFLERTAACLARRDERVLIINAVCPGMAEPTGLAIVGEELASYTGGESRIGRRDGADGAGLSNYLAFEFAWPSDVVHASGVCGVDRLSCGTAVISPDCFATHRMRELLEMFRQKYSVILVAGPPVASVADVLTLSAYQDGAVVLLDEPNPTTAGTQELFATYRRLGVPFLGCIDLAE